VVVTLPLLGAFELPARRLDLLGKAVRVDEGFVEAAFGVLLEAVQDPAGEVVPG